MKKFLFIPALTSGFFFAACIVMLFWGALADDFGLPTISYVKAMVLTTGLWLVVAPLAIGMGWTMGFATGCFFFSAWLLMIFWGIFAGDLGVPTVSYVKAMGLTIGLWLVVASLRFGSRPKGDGRTGKVRGREWHEWCNWNDD